MVRTSRSSHTKSGLPTGVTFAGFDHTFEQAKVWFETSRESKDSTESRAAAYAIIDYYKQILDVSIIEARLQFDEGANVETKFRSLRDRLPKLEKWASLANSVERLRNKVHHTEIASIPRKDVEILIDAAPSFLSDLSLEVRRRNSGLSRVEMLDEELGAIEGDVARLRSLPSIYDVPAEMVENQAMELSEIHENLVSLRDWIKRLDPPRIPRLLVIARWCAHRVSDVVLEVENEAYNLDEMNRMEEEEGESERRLDELRSNQG